MTSDGDVIFIRHNRNGASPMDTLVPMSQDLSHTYRTTAVSYPQSEDYSMILSNGFIYFNGFNNENSYRVNADNGQMDASFHLPIKPLGEGSSGYLYGFMMTNNACSLVETKYDGSETKSFNFTYNYNSIKLGSKQVIYVTTVHKR